ncbi:hypothetical protein NP233_g13041 [Leucocoprinus birnbaumii]|uniref:Tyr recombinase domain-containing protein n=1 Tax=Leucocoprinus birnbaumii TaxID=56174 RepID=A0AAD5VHJ2_9AGAR|nr:hypothetical protein NP233_g13041 [Leucocoprinus birnbaumii]
MSDYQVFETLQSFIDDTSSKSLTTDIEVSDDIEEEQLALKAEKSTDDTSPELLSSVHAVSRGVSDETHTTYQRLMKKCEQFLQDNGYLDNAATFFSESPSRLAPYHLILWIQDACDTVKYDRSGSYIERPSTEVRLSYTHAMKMRAAATYGFGRVHQLGDAAWRHSPISDTWEGNPSLASLVSTYMVSLRRRKVQAGEAPISARAVTPELLKQLWNHNVHSPFYSMSQVDFEAYVAKQSKSERLANGVWCGPRGLRLLNLVYTLAFTCLLRIDEVLKIQYQDLIPISEKDASKAVLKLQLPFRKTDQHGDIKPFILHEMPKDMMHLCPIRAFARWVNATNTNEGFIFRRIASGDRLGEGSLSMTAEAFLEMFRMNLLDIGVDPAPYGTDSFRRGGCQWMSVHLRKPWRDICEWGGWSTDLSYLTIVKYLISGSDEPTERRENYFNFEKLVGEHCTYCGRRCPCGFQ